MGVKFASTMLTPKVVVVVAAAAVNDMAVVVAVVATVVVAAAAVTTTSHTAVVVMVAAGEVTRAVMVVPVATMASKANEVMAEVVVDTMAVVKVAKETGEDSKIITTLQVVVLVGNRSEAVFHTSCSTRCAYSKYLKKSGDALRQRRPTYYAAFLIRVAPVFTKQFIFKIKNLTLNF